MRAHVFIVIASLTALSACGSPIVKPEAFDAEILARTPLPAGQIVELRRSERRVEPGLAWLGDVDPTAAPIFAGYRLEDGGVAYALVLACEPETDRLSLLLLDEGTSPLDVLADPERRAAARRSVEAGARDADPAAPGLGTEIAELSLRGVIDERRLGPPIPPPRRVFAVAANYPSHLTHDLGIKQVEERRRVMGAARARVFLKHPATPPPDGSAEQAATSAILGPYDTITFPRFITLPPGPNNEPGRRTETRVDYEAEIGIVMGRRLDEESIAGMTDDEIRAAVAGIVLVSDSKARNPQVFQKVAALDRKPDPDDPFRLGHPYLDAALAVWDETTVQWWSYAASRGSYTSLGPFLVAATPRPDDPPRALLSARSYAPPERRHAPIPRGRTAGTLYLRQVAGTTEDPSYPDALFWTVPKIVRSILEPGSALGFMDDLALDPGDVICLGTPGGTTITAKPHGLVNALADLMFFWKPIDFHDAFFDADAELYLRNDDELLLWAEGLGFQHLDVREVK